MMNDENETVQESPGRFASGHERLVMSPFMALIQVRRKAKKWSLQQAADKLGCTKTHLWELEQGRTANPKANLLNAMRREYNIGAKALLNALDS